MSAHTSQRAFKRKLSFIEHNLLQMGSLFVGVCITAEVETTSKHSNVFFAASQANILPVTTSQILQLADYVVWVLAW